MSKKHFVKEDIEAVALSCHGDKQLLFCVIFHDSEVSTNCTVGERQLN